MTAERLGPREFYQFDDPQMTPVVGPRGEHAVSLLSSRGSQEVLSELERDGTPPNLARQVEAWMAEFFPGCVLETNRVAGTNTMTLGIRTSGDTDHLLEFWDLIRGNLVVEWRTSGRSAAW